MKKIPIVDLPNGSRAPAEPYPENSVEIRGDVEAGYMVCYQPGDDIPPMPEAT